MHEVHAGVWGSEQGQGDCPEAVRHAFPKARSWGEAEGHTEWVVVRDPIRSWDSKTSGNQERFGTSSVTGEAATPWCSAALLQPRPRQPAHWLGWLYRE